MSKNQAASDLARTRWAKASQEDKQEQARKMRKKINSLSHQELSEHMKKVRAAGKKKK